MADFFLFFLIIFFGIFDRIFFAIILRQFFFHAQTKYILPLSPLFFRSFSIEISLSTSAFYSIFYSNVFFSKYFSFFYLSFIKLSIVTLSQKRQVKYVYNHKKAQEGTNESFSFFIKTDYRCVQKSFSENYCIS